MSAPKLKWDVNTARDVWEAIVPNDSGADRCRLVVYRLDDSPCFFAGSTWCGCYLICERTDCTDVADAMVRCEERTRDVLLAEFGQLLGGAR